MILFYLYDAGQNHLLSTDEYGHAEDGLSVVTGHGVNLPVEPFVLVGIHDVQRLARQCHMSGNAFAQRETAKYYIKNNNFCEYAGGNKVFINIFFVELLKYFSVCFPHCLVYSFLFTRKIGSIFHITIKRPYKQNCVYM
jgi:hypothetical protein